MEAVQMTEMQNEEVQPKVKKVRAPYAYLVIFHANGETESRVKEVANRGELKDFITYLGDTYAVDKILKTVGEVKMKQSVEFEF